MVDNSIKRIDKYQYSTKEPIGVGSFGKVYKGTDQQTGLVVAVKQIDKKVLKNDSYLMQGFSQEIQVMKKLKGKNVVQLLDVLETGNNYYVIQEFCEGGDLLKVLKKVGSLGEAQAIQILIQLLTGFKELLEQGIIHRDLKPDNILIHQGVYKIADFGFAKIVQNFNTQMLQSLVGTPLYMSPQILKQDHYTTKSDIWSLAFVYYEMIFGLTPWTANSQYQLIQNIQNIPLRFPGYISEDSKDFLKKCLAIDEQDRITWDEIYQHRLIKPYFQNQSTNIVENREKFAINQARQRILSLKVELDDIFLSLNLSYSSQLNFQDFQTLMHRIDPFFLSDEIENMFKYFDKNQTGRIQFSEFLNWLQQSNIRLSMKQQQELQPIQQSPQRLESYEVRNYNLSGDAIYVLYIINQGIQKFKGTADLLYRKYDKSQMNQMNFNDFSYMVSKIKQDMPEDKKLSAFSSIDGGKGFITSAEFTQALNQSQSSSQQLPQQINQQLPQLANLQSFDSPKKQTTISYRQQGGFMGYGQQVDYTNQNGLMNLVNQGSTNYQPQQTQQMQPQYQATGLHQLAKQQPNVQTTYSYQNPQTQGQQQQQQGGQGFFYKQ